MPNERRRMPNERRLCEATFASLSFCFLDLLGCRAMSEVMRGGRHGCQVLSEGAHFWGSNHFWVSDDVTLT